MKEVDPKYKQKEWLNKKYNIEKMSATKIAKLEGVSYQTIYRWLDKFNIPIRDIGFAKCIQSRNKLVPSNDLLNVITGGLLGDGHIASKRRFSGVYQHVSKFRTYIEHLKKKFEKSGLDTSKIIKDINGSGTRYRLRTKSYSFLMRLREKWYRNREKIIPPSISLNPTTMLYWFMDDGQCRGNQSIILHTQGFTPNDVDKLIKRLKDNMGINCWRNNHSKGHIWPYIYIPVSFSENFFNYCANLPSELKDTFGYKFV